ncbi:S8 family serine peptidase [Streptococcus merionis]|uniref:SubtilisiN-like serine protease n=1 Tax=Streptococcus merionis TaxID=400065 RepID=A0A239SRZ1_9STRE|nr:S8 family serine peptidase [Streptococcus merionis]SNU87484.1 subtilisiN-like serine protease [Streptococcus merionis]
MEKKQKFSLRKYKVGAVSVLLGAVFLLSHAQVVTADELASNTDVVATVATTSSDSETPLEASVETALETVSSSETANPVAAQDSVSPETPLSLTKESPDNTSEETLSETESEPKATKTEEAAQPQNIDSNTVINVPKTWENGYKGQGMVVAIIDSGLDVEHDVLKISDMSKAKYKSEDEMKAAMEKAGITYGKWYNDKVIYGYNYVDVNTELKEADKTSHGMHVTGIAAGNPSKPVGEEYIYGVAPEAQVMFMRVFSDVHNRTGAALYVQAINDAVKLGADSINLSLGSATGSLANTDEQLNAAIEMARKAGVSVVIAAGNDGTFGSGHTLPLATNPDYGLVGNPSTARDAISVASFNNTTVMGEVVQIVGLENDEKLNHGKSSFTNPDVSDKKFENNKEYELVYAELGKPEDFAGKDFTGKLALIKRGEITFSDKIANAAANGAVGVVIFNHTAGEANISMGVDDDNGRTIPSIFIPAEFGEALAANSNLKLMFKGEVEKTAHPKTGEFSDFSSWGLTADGELKPDISAPGGGIFASINDNEYSSMNGTSMAAPHVAGAAALVKQYLKGAYPEKTAEELEALVKNLMMSTAKPHLNAETKAYSSPRQQGAGLLDATAAITTGLYVTGTDNYGSITLGNVGEVFSFDVVVHNITNETKTLNYKTHVNTDSVEKGLVTLSPKELSQIDGNVISIAPNSSTTVKITVDTTAYTEELSKEMPNGYYLEGFVRFVDPVDGADVISIPYVGFKGKFQDLDVLEKPVYELISDGKGGVYFAPKDDKVVPGREDFTGLVTFGSEVIYSNAETRINTGLKLLGTFANKDGKFVLEVDGSGTPYLAISPNGDGNQDFLALKGVFLRNYNNLMASVYRADDVNLENPLWSSEPAGGRKNYFSGVPENPKSTIVVPTEWSGYDNDGQPLEDGFYKYVLTYYPDVIGADKQTMVFDVVVDRQSPEITTAKYDDKTFVFTPRKPIVYGPSPIVRDQVFYLAKDSAGNASVIKRDPETGQITIGENKVYIAPNADGSFTLPLDLAKLSDFYYTVEDFAGNLVSAKVEDLVAVGNDLGLVEVNVLDQETNRPTAITYSFSVKDANGNLVTDLPRNGSAKNVLKLPFGTYTFEVFLYDTENSVMTDKKAVVVNLTEDASLQRANFFVKLLPKEALTVVFNQTVPEGTTVNLTTENGATISLPAAKYKEAAFGKDVPVGEYNLSVTLPEGFDILEDLSLTVLEGQQNVKTLTLINKQALLATSSEDMTENPVYYNADPELQKTYQEALKLAQQVAANKNDQATVDQATQALLKAKAALNGQATDKSALEKLAKASEELVNQEDVRYKHATSQVKSNFDKQLALAKQLLTKEHVSQTDIDEALALLDQAKAALNGVEPKSPNPVVPKPPVENDKESEDVAPAPPIVVQPSVQLDSAVVSTLNHSATNEPQNTGAILNNSLNAKPKSLAAVTGKQPDNVANITSKTQSLPQTGDQDSQLDKSMVLIGWIVLTISYLAYRFERKDKNI